jgi:ankyrin repeat protein
MGINDYIFGNYIMSPTIDPSQEIIDQFVGNAHGNFAVVKDLLEKYPALLNANASWTETAIQAATQAAQVEIVNYLLDHGAELDICTAAMLGRQDCVEDFVKTDPNLVHARGAHGIPLLYFPIIRGHLMIAEFLLTHGADPNAALPGGFTPLHGAVMFNQPQMVAWLLDHGADPNPRYDGKTPLSMALAKEQTELVVLLRSHNGTE